MKYFRLRFLPAVFALLFATSGIAAEPGEVVRQYIYAFKQKDKEGILRRLSDSFFAEYKTQYIAKVESYPKEKQKVLLKIYELETLDQLKAMTGRSILSSFLDKPESKSYWSSFDSIDLMIEVETLEVKEEKATVRSLMWSKLAPETQIETLYTLMMNGADWRIDRFTKKQIHPNKAPVPTATSVTPASDAPVAPATAAAHL